MPKIPTAMWALLAEHIDDFEDNDTAEHELFLLAAIESALITSLIPTPLSYKEAVDDPKWGELW